MGNRGVNHVVFLRGISKKGKIRLLVLQASALYD